MNIEQLKKDFPLVSFAEVDQCGVLHPGTSRLLKKGE
jgi:hypothetical protein